MFEKNATVSNDVSLMLTCSSSCGCTCKPDSAEKTGRVNGAKGTAGSAASTSPS